MIVIIRGRARAEICSIKKKDLEKHYFEHRKSQLYKVFPDDMHRMTIYKYGVMQKKEEEVIVYPENSLKPDHPQDQCYEFDVMASELAQHKLMLPKSTFGKINLMMKQINQTKKSLMPILPMMIVCLVVAYAFIFG